MDPWMIGWQAPIGFHQVVPARSPLKWTLQGHLRHANKTCMPVHSRACMEVPQRRSRGVSSMLLREQEPPSPQLSAPAGSIRRSEAAAAAAVATSTAQAVSKSEAAAQALLDEVNREKAAAAKKEKKAVAKKHKAKQEPRKALADIVNGAEPSTSSTGNGKKELCQQMGFGVVFFPYSAPERHVSQNGSSHLLILGGLNKQASSLLSKMAGQFTLSSLT